MIASKLTSKAQTMIPQPVRAALRLVEGDELAYEIDGGKVILKKLIERGAEDPFGAFAEWDSPADRKAYAKLCAWRRRPRAFSPHGSRDPARLREASEAIVFGEGGRALLADALATSTGWRAIVPSATCLPWQPMVLHRGGYPDGS